MLRHAMIEHIIAEGMDIHWGDDESLHAGIFPQPLDAVHAFVQDRDDPDIAVA